MKQQKFSGYGNIACRTYMGKMLTIVYAIVGIPIMLLFLTNIGDILAKLFTSLYRRCVAAVLHLKLWNRRRQIAEKRRQALAKPRKKLRVALDQRRTGVLTRS